MAAGPKVLYEFGPFRVDPEKHILLRGSQPVAITPKTFETLLILVRHSREVVSKDDLMNELWPDAFVEEANLSQNIFMLRKALGDRPEDRRYIVTLPGKGYRFVADVRTVNQAGEDVIVASRSRSHIVIEHTDGPPAEILPAPPATVDRKRGWYRVAAIGTVAALLVVAMMRSPSPPAYSCLEREGLGFDQRFHEHDRRSGVRWCAASRLGDTA